jgi:hypothetical protein
MTDHIDEKRFDIIVSAPAGSKIFLLQGFPPDEYLVDHLAHFMRVHRFRFPSYHAIFKYHKVFGQITKVGIPELIVENGSDAIEQDQGTQCQQSNYPAEEKNDEGRHHEYCKEGP